MKQKIIMSNYDSLGNPTYAGGGARAIHEIAKRLSIHYHVTVVTGRYAGARDVVYDDVHYEHIGTTISPQCDQLNFQFALLHYAQTHDAICWLENFTPPAVLGLLPRVTSRPVIGLTHMLPARDMERKYHLPFSVIENWRLHAYQHLLATSPYFAKELRKINPIADVTMIPNGIDHVSGLAIARKPKALVYLGRIEMNQKGLDLLLAAYREIESSRLPLYIAGTGAKSEVRQLQKQIASMPNVRYMGKVDGQAKANLLAQAKIMIVPSRFETFSLVAGEALRAGIPLVTTPIPGFAWIPSSVRWTARAVEATELAKTIMTVLRTHGTTQAKVQAGLRFAAEYTWDKAAEHYLSLIRKVAYV
jgi:glycosyltransferase involved in cell wall biosynthesis